MTEFASRPVFLDEIDFVAFGGDGGDGCVAFRREKFVPKGGPSGGDGGNGGSVLVQTDEQYNTLQHLAGHHHFRAQHGQQGMGSKCHGKKGQDLIVRVPPGTIVFDAEHHLVLKDLVAPGDRVCVAAGGKGGRGNVHFKSSTNQTPRQAEEGTPGEIKSIHLELKLIADAGLVGLPNAGKSTLLSRLSAARPKVAAYPFTTLSPHLGIVELVNWRRFVMADIPGLIEGAHAGAGLGHEFLRHIERTKLLVHMVDVAPLDGDPVEAYRVIRNELQSYSPALAAKPEIVVANKIDLTGGADNAKRLAEETGQPVVAISAVTGAGLERLGERIWQELAAIDQDQGDQRSNP
jgi:GTP-binding protein